MKRKYISILTHIALLLGPFSVWAAQAPSSSWDPSELGGFGLPDGSIYQIISNLVGWMLGIFGFIGIVGFVISGILYLTAAGDAEQEKKAKKAMTMSIVGIVVGLAGLVIIFAANSALVGTSQRF